MQDKSMVIISDRLVSKIDEFRGQMSRADFVRECVESVLYGWEAEVSERASARESRGSK